MSKESKDNSTLPQKISFRRKALRAVQGEPVIMETHGGTGLLYLSCYRHVERGVVIEKDNAKIAVLASQRDTWAIYQGDSAKTILCGAGSHLPVNFVDVDPWGDPWPTIKAFLWSERPKAASLQIVVHDGMRQKCQQDGGWNAESLKPMLLVYGSELAKHYMAACQSMMAAIALEAGYTIETWAGYHLGRQDLLTHYWAGLRHAG